MLFGLAAGLSLDSNAANRAFLAARDEPAVPSAGAPATAPTTGPVPPPAGVVPGLEFHLNLPSLDWSQLAAHPEVRASLREVIKGGAFEMVHALMLHGKDDPVMPDIDSTEDKEEAAASGAPASAPMAAPGTEGDDHPPMPTKMAAPVAPAEEPEFVNSPAGVVAAAPGEATPTPLNEVSAPAAAAPAVAEVAAPVVEAGAPAAAAEEPATPALSEVENKAKDGGAEEAAPAQSNAQTDDDNVDSEDESFVQLQMKSKSQAFFSFEGTARVDPAAIKKEEDDGKLRIFVEFEETGNEQVAARVTAKGELSEFELF